MLQQLRYLLEYAVARIIFCVLQSLRIESCAASARGLGYLCADVLRLRHRTIDENLRSAFPKWSAAQRRDCTRRMWAHLFLFAAEIAHLSRKNRITNYARTVDIRNRDLFCPPMFEGRGTIFLSAHFGVFEMMGYNAGLIGFPNYSVARKLDNPYLDRLINRFRSATGQYLIDKDGATEPLLKLLRDGALVGIIGDQYAGRKGCWVEFFGRPASAHKAIALLSLENDCPLVVCSCRRLGRPMRHSMEVHAVFDPRTAPPEMRTVPAVTQWFTREFEKMIRLAPEQYWWMHRRWRDPRPPRRRSAAPAAPPHTAVRDEPSAAA